MIRRIGPEDAGLANRFLNHCDTTNLLRDSRNVCLCSEGGAAMFAWRGPGIFEGHSAFGVRGRAAIVLGKEMIAAMFHDHGARMIWGATPHQNRAARWFNRQIGFRSTGNIDVPEYGGACELFVLENA